jgi:hypothetical protein
MQDQISAIISGVSATLIAASILGLIKRAPRWLAMIRSMARHRDENRRRPPRTLPAESQGVMALRALFVFVAVLILAYTLIGLALIGSAILLRSR